MPSHLAPTLPADAPPELQSEPSNIAAAIEAARAAQRKWAAVPLAARLKVLRRLRHLLAAQAMALAHSIQIPNRTADESLMAEVLPLADAIRFLERSAPRLLRPKDHGAWGRPAWLFGSRLQTRREPLGVVLVVSPRNYPLLLAGSHAMQALAAGNAVVVKASPSLGGCMRALRELAINAGLPADLFAIRDGDAADVYSAIESGVDKVVLTGGAAAGRAVLARLAPKLTPAVMELSGCDGAFVLDGADLDLVARALAFGLRFNGSATCIAPRRCFVPKSLAGQLEEKLRQRLNAIGSIEVPRASAAQFYDLLADAEARGGRLVVGLATSRDVAPTASVGPVGSALADATTSERFSSTATSTASAKADPTSATSAAPHGGVYVLPTVVADLSPEAKLASADIFAPVVGLIPVNDMAEAQRLNQACPYALGASIFGPETDARTLAESLDVGTVTINDVIIPTADPRLTFGGIRQSGFGATRGPAGLLEMTHVKEILLNAGNIHVFLDPLHPADGKLFAGYLLMMHGATWNLRIRGAMQALSSSILRSKSHTATPPPAQRDANSLHAGAK